jgi:putative membrane protein
MMFGRYGFGNATGFLGIGSGIFMGLLFLLLIGVGVFCFISVLRHPKSGNFDRPESDALKILNERYAKGEISDEEYLNKKRNLQ